MTHKCSYADKYKAIYPPTCGCDYCKKKWEDNYKARQGFKNE